ncbi:MAG: endospore germination permease [Clostridiaceae bacterium]|nr:endospore germination permease [Clostridiaceae bacterium]
MKIDKGEISGTQFMFSVACFIQSAALLTAFLVSITLQDSWLVVLLGFILGLLLLWVFRNLMVMFPEQNLIQILDNVYGPVIGKIIGVGYIWFFFTLTSINFMDIGDFVKQTMLKETPILILVILCMLVSVIAVRDGITLVTKYSTLFVVVTIFILIFSVLLVINQINLQNFLPMFDQPFMKYVQGTHLITTIPFGETVALLMIHPNVKQSRRDTTKHLFVGFALGVITVLVIIMRDITTLGNTMEMFTLPHVVALSLANLGPALSRIEILFFIVFIMLMFFRITLLYYVSVLAVAYLMKIKAYRHIVLVMGTLMLFYGLTLYPNPVAHALSAQQIVPFLWTPFEILIPLLTLIIAKIRKMPQAKMEAKEE